MFGITGIVGPTLVGALFDTTGSYQAGFLVVGCLGLLGAAILPLVHHFCPEDCEGVQEEGVQEQEVQEEGVQEEGVQEEEVQEEGVQEENVQEEGVQEKGVQEEGV